LYLVLVTGSPLPPPLTFAYVCCCSGWTQFTPPYLVDAPAFAVARLLPAAYARYGSCLVYPCPLPCTGSGSPVNIAVVTLRLCLGSGSLPYVLPHNRAFNATFALRVWLRPWVYTDSTRDSHYGYTLPRLHTHICLYLRTPRTHTGLTCRTLYVTRYDLGCCGLLQHTLFVAPQLVSAFTLVVGLLRFRAVCTTRFLGRCTDSRFTHARYRTRFQFYSRVCGLPRLRGGLTPHTAAIYPHPPLPPCDVAPHCTPGLVLPGLRSRLLRVNAFARLRYARPVHLRRVVPTRFAFGVHVPVRLVCPLPLPRVVIWFWFVTHTRCGLVARSLPLRCYVCRLPCVPGHTRCHTAVVTTLPFIAVVAPTVTHTFACRTPGHAHTPQFADTRTWFYLARCHGLQLPHTHGRVVYTRALPTWIRLPVGYGYALVGCYLLRVCVLVYPTLHFALRAPRLGLHCHCVI